MTNNDNYREYRINDSDEDSWFGKLYVYIYIFLSTNLLTLINVFPRSLMAF